MNQLIVVGITFLAIAAANADRNLQQPPATLPGDFPRLGALLRTVEGREIETRDAWQKQRAALRKQWVEFMGGLPKTKAPLKAEFLENEDLPGFTRQYVRYQVEQGILTDGYLLTPKNLPGQLPVIVVFHPTTPLQARGVAGLAEEYAEEKRQGIQLVQRGYLVWCPRNFIFTEGGNDLKGIEEYTSNTKWMQQRHPKWSGMTRMVWDAIRAADFIESLPNADIARLGCLGHSLGGKVALYAPAFDERYRASVSSEGGIGLKFSNWEAIWYHGLAIKRPDFKLENHQVLALVAPRPFLLLAGDSADSDKSWAFIDAVRPVYKLLGASENIGWFNHHLGHRYAPEARTVAEEFFDRHLKKR
jgi:dienelactone hydrolase